jgi:polysaccharide export outer membrane protein
MKKSANHSRSEAVVLKKTRFFAFIVLSIWLSSCVTQRDVEYLQTKSIASLSFHEPVVADYTLKPNDELYIQISSLDDPSLTVFSGLGGQQAYYAGTIEPYGASLISYAIDKDGFLNLPVIGRVQVTDKTTSQVSELLKESLTNVLNQPVVTVKLVNRYVTVLGEVLRPGHYVCAKEKITIFEAIGLAGDITDYGNRREIMLTRNIGGQNIIVFLDLSEPSLLESPFYYLRPNDVVYIKPLARKFWGLRQFPYAVVISTLTTAILLYSVIQR